MVTRLTERQIRYAVGQRKEGRSAAAIAGELGVTPRRVRQLWAEFRATGKAHVPPRPGRPGGRHPFRQLEGVAQEMRGCGPDHSTIRRRILALDV